MRIAQIAPLAESVPPKHYGGTERVVSYLTEELVRQGHDVTLFASGDSVTSAKLIAPVPQALRLANCCKDPVAAHLLTLEQVYKRADRFDIAHFHIDYLHFFVSRRYSLPHVTTLHGRLDIPELALVFKEYREVPVISISHAQREPLPWLHYVGTVYHGLPNDLYRLCESCDDYLLFLGRISPEKRPDLAIEIARKAGVRLKIAAKVDAVDQEYFDQVIKPMLDGPLVEFLGEVSEADKGELLGRARAMLFPIDWPEPFGLVMIEAMACGTPVIAYRRASVPEVLEHGVTGFIVDSVDEAVAAVQRASELSRVRCRAEFERRFCASRMAQEYLAIYERLQRAEHSARMAVGLESRSTVSTAS